jgi:phage-related minor tail protein
MIMPVEVGVGYVSVVPEARGFGRMLSRQIDGEASAAGGQAGEQAGQGVLGGMRDQIKAGAAAVGLALGAAVADATVQAVEKERLTDRLSAQLGTSGKSAEGHGKVAGKLYAKGVTDSFEAGTEAVRSVMATGLLPVDATSRQIETIATRVSDLATTFDQDLAGAAQAAASMVKSGLADDAGQALDILTRGFQRGADAGGDLLDTFAGSSVNLRQFGFTAESAMGVLIQAMDAGAPSTDAFTGALEELIGNASDGVETFDKLGLGGEAFANKLAGGGPGAAAALDQLLDRIRQIESPAQRSATIVELFGEEATALQGALLAVDPSSAADKLGKFEGAAKGVGDTIRSNTATELTVLTRQLRGAFSGVATSVAVPALRGVIDAVQWTGDAFAAGARWVRDYGAWLLPLGVAVAGLTITMNASAIATGAVTAVFSVYRGVLLAASAVTRGYAIVQGVLNAVMAANPVGLIITGIAALVTLLVVAYKKSDTFRGIVQAAWSGIKAGWDVLWNSALKPGFGYLMTGLRAVGSWASWLWTTAIGPAFHGIMTVAKVLFTVLTVVVITPIMLYLKALGAVAGWLWQHAIGPAFRGIVTLAQWWWAGVKLYFGLVKNVISAVGAAGMWLWQKAIAPAFRGIVTLASWWWTGVKLYFGYVKTGITAVGAAGTWLYRNAIQPAFTAIASAASFLWTKGLKPIFDTGKRGVGLFGAAFDTAQKAIGIAFGKIKDVTKRPVNFVIGTVYSNGIKKVWDGVAGFVGLDKLPAAPKLLAEGGRTRGGIPGKDSIPALMMADEFVVKRSSARSVGFDTLQYINEHGELPVQRFADGGIVGDVAGWIGGKAKAIGSAVMDGADFLSNPGKLWDKATKFIREKIASIGQSRFAQMIGKFPIKMLSGLKDKIVKAATNMFGGSSADIGGSGVQRWSSVVLQALKLVGQPASLLPTVLRRMNQESGGNPRAINNWDINARNGTPSKGLMQVIDPTFNAYAGKLRSRGVWDPLANIYASMRYALSRYGSLASAYNRPGGYANGGRPRPGEVAWVGERGPELLQFGGGQTVLDTDSSLAAVGAAMVRSMARSLPQPVPTAANLRPVVPAAGGQATTPAGHTYNIYPRTLDMTVSDLELLQRRQDALARVGRPR